MGTSMDKVKHELTTLKNRVNIMDIPFINSTQYNFFNHCVIPFVIHNEKCFIVTANPEIVMHTRLDQKYKKVVQSATYVIPDGVGIIHAARRLGHPLQERITGYDLMTDMLHYANEHHLKCFFLGASENVNKQAVNKIKEQFPNIKVAGRHHGYIKNNDMSVVDDVALTNADFVFVALGFPKQEKWIATHL